MKKSFIREMLFLHGADNNFAAQERALYAAFLKVPFLVKTIFRTLIFSSLRLNIEASDHTSRLYAD
jgi:hypothetical protein